MKKTLQELTIKDNFMFGAVMMIPENCKEFLEMVIGKTIERVVVSKEKSIIYHPEYKGVRLDVYAEDEERTHYNVEMQVLKKPALGKRSRYYQSQLDMELLLSGSGYEELPNTYVIFICDFDPFGEKKYRYTFRNQCEESKKAELDDGRHIIFLSTKGTDKEKVPRELVRFLEFVKADLKGSQGDFKDEYIERLQKTIFRVKESREMEERFMVLKEMLSDEHKAGFEEGREEGREEGLLRGCEGMRLRLLKGLKHLGQPSESLIEKIEEEQSLETLEAWVDTVFEVESVEEFITKIS